MGVAIGGLLRSDAGAAPSWGLLGVSCGALEVSGSREVAGDGGEVDLHGGLGEAAPSHASQAGAALARPDYRLDPGAGAVDSRIVPEQKGLRSRVTLTGPQVRGERGALGCRLEAREAANMNQTLAPTSSALHAQVS